MISHAVHDNHRPSVEFQKFVKQLELGGVAPALLFTSEPQLDRVENVKHLIAPLRPAGRAGSWVGDVMLTFDGDDWKVNEHSIEVC
jgi:hypothetical protein